MRALSSRLDPGKVKLELTKARHSIHWFVIPGTAVSKLGVADSSHGTSAFRAETGAPRLHHTTHPMLRTLLLLVVTCARAAWVNETTVAEPQAVRMTEEAFLAKWGHVSMVRHARTRATHPPASTRAAHPPARQMPSRARARAHGAGEPRRAAR